MSIRNLERMSGVSNAEICKLLSGKRVTPNPFILKKIAPFLNLDYLYLFYLAGYIEEHDWEKFKSNRFIIAEEQPALTKGRKRKDEGLLMKNEEFQLLTHFRNIPSTKTRQSILHLSQESSKISKETN